MDPNVFRKGDASSCLVVDKTFEEIINKPDFFAELTDRIVAMVDNAEELGMALKSTTLRQFKDLINGILLAPLQMHKPEYDVEDANEKRPDTILADAFWDEILMNDSKWEKLKEALAKAYDMKTRIDENRPLTSADKLQDAKDNFNDTIVKPLLGISQRPNPEGLGLRVEETLSPS